MIRFFVNILLKDDPLPRRCGELLFEEPDARGRITAAFRYATAFLVDPAAFPLDPVSLPLSPEVVQAHLPAPGFGVFEDTLPDDWGRRLLVRKAGLDREHQRLPHLLKAIGASALGALSFLERDAAEPPPPDADAVLLEVLLAQAEAFERDATVSDRDIAALLRAGSSPGGARPKALVDTGDNRRWIAKFPRREDRMSVITIEAATMRLAAAAGLRVPEIRTLHIAEKPVLLVERFDITPGGGRHHMISMQTLLRADQWYHLGYDDLMDVVRRISDHPREDLQQLFRQMVFNAAVGNTDDHLKNFTMLHDHGGWHLSPAYDLLPDIDGRREHVLRIDLSNTFSARSALENTARRHGIRGAVDIISEVIDAVSNWRQGFSESGVTQDDIEHLSPDIERRLQRMRMKG
ncbi:MAG: type II toxin-antitoxin system HipA family toxin [Pseudomonadota bacterium]